MISYDEALGLLQGAVRPAQAVRRPLRHCAGTVTAAPIVALVDLPGFDNAAMDGFALSAGLLASAGAARPVILPLAGSVHAGDPPPSRTPPGHAWEIMTGAALPADCDTVVPLERTARHEGNAGPPAVHFTSPALAGGNVRRRGEDFHRGDPVCGAGVRLDPRHLMALAGTGHDEILVRDRPRVAVLMTGSELAGAGIPPAPGHLRDANGPYLLAALERLGARVTGEAWVPDQPAELAAALARLARDCDVLVTTGGVSAGRLDLVPAAVAALGADLLFHKVAIRPGKPVLAAHLADGPWLLGLPGNPVAVAVGVRFFLVPLLRVLQGLAPETHGEAGVTAEVRRRGTLRFFAKARTGSGTDGAAQVTILPGQESFRIAPLLAANAWAVIAEGDGAVAAGERVPVVSLFPDD